MLEGGAARARGTKKSATRSVLAGKLFDETGDRLIPSHSKKNGKRLRYYISRRLVTERKVKHPNAWRLPAEEVETLLVKLIGQHIGRPDAATSILKDASAAKILTAVEILQSLNGTAACLALVRRVDLRPGSLTLQMDDHAMSQILGCRLEQINTTALTIAVPFRMRRRGVELKLHLGDPAPEVDLTLARNIVKARRWLGMIINGRTFAEIAEQDGVSKRRIQDVVDLAFLAPEHLGAIASGTQPDGLTTDYLIKTGITPVWSEQRVQFVHL